MKNNGCHYLNPMCHFKISGLFTQENVTILNTCREDHVLTSALVGAVCHDSASKDSVKNMGHLAVCLRDWYMMPCIHIFKAACFTVLIL